MDGRILNLKTGLPIRKALVHLAEWLEGSGAPGIGFSQETDAEGHFAFTDLQPGRYELTASRDGFLKQSFGPRRNAATPIVLAASERRNDIVVRLPPLSVIAGRIVDEGGEPVTDLEVVILKLQLAHGRREWTRAGSAITSDLGEYRIPKLAPGRYLVKTLPKNSPLASENQSPDAPLQETAETIYPATYYPGTRDESGAVPVVTGTGVEIRGIDISLAPVRAFRIRGTLAKPADMAAVVAWEREGGGARQIALNIPAGENRFELRGMPAGSYVIYAEPQDSEVRALARQMVVVTNKPVDGLVMNMVPASEIRGRVQMEEEPAHADMSKLSVELRTAAIYFFEPTAVTKNLTFVLKDVVPAHFEVEAVGTPDCCFVKSIRYGGIEIGDAGSEFISGNTLQITLSGTAGQISGTVTDGDQPVSGATVVLRPKQAGALAREMSLTTDENGAFRFTGLKPGEYRVIALDGIDPGSYPDPDAIDLLESSAMSVSVEANGRKTIKLRLSAVDPKQESHPGNN